MQQNNPVISKIEELRFNNIHEALSFYRSSNPCRRPNRSVTCYEPERGSKSQDLVDNHPPDIHAAILGGIQACKARHKPEVYRAFALYHLGETKRVTDRTGIPQEETELFGVAQIAERFGLQRSTIWRWLRKFEADLDAELVRRELIPPPEFPEEAA